MILPAEVHWQNLTALTYKLRSPFPSLPLQSALGYPKVLKTYLVLHLLSSITIKPFSWFQPLILSIFDFNSESSHMSWLGWPIHLSKTKQILFRVPMIKALFKISQLKVWLTMYKEPGKLGIILYICLPQNILITSFFHMLKWPHYLVFLICFKKSEYIHIKMIDDWFFTY